MEKISVIIPTYNEEQRIKNTLDVIRSRAYAPVEIIVVDGSSSDKTVHIVQKSGISCIKTDFKSRAMQMNKGAVASTGEILYFLHADTTPPKHFDLLISRSVHSGFSAGCFRLRFDSRHWFLSGLSFFTRFKSLWFRYGDQSLFTTHSAFKEVKGFKENMTIMEDQDIVKRLQRNYPFQIIKEPVITSARRFKDNGIYRLFSIYLRLFILNKVGINQDRLVKIYRSKIHSGKV